MQSVSEIKPVPVAVDADDVVVDAADTGVFTILDSDGKRRDAADTTPTRLLLDATTAAAAAVQTHITAIKLTEFLKKCIS